MMFRASKIAVGVLFSASLLQGQSMTPGSISPHSKTKKNKTVRDPTLSRSALPTAQFTEESEQAFKRSGQVGVLQAKSPTPGRIYEIRVIGAQKTEPEAVLVLLKSQINQPLHRESIQEDIRAILKMGLFADVQFHQDRGPNGSILLTIRLTEKATLYKVRFIGNQEILESGLEEVIDLKPYQIADVMRIRENAEKIRKLYIEKGFLLATVSYEIKASQATDLLKDETVKATDFVEVIFHIEEDAKTKIDQITILGNRTLSTDRIKASMRSKEKHPLSFITQWGLYNEEMLDIDALLIEQLYQEHGYLNVQVSKPRAALSPDKTRISVHISLTEGEPFSLGTLEVDGDRLDYSEDFLRDHIELQQGDVFNKTQLMKDLVSIQELYRDQGYAYVNISPEPQIHEQEHIVDLKLQIDPGPLVYFGRFEIKGNTSTVDEVIRRELRIYEGELYSASLLRLSEQRLNQLGYFESVQMDTKPSAQNPDHIDVEIVVKEKKLGQIQVGGGYGTGGEGLLFQGQVTQNNLFGRGQSLSAVVQLSAYRRIFELSFSDPYLLYLNREPVSFSLRAYHTQRFLIDYYRGNSGGELGFGYPIGSFLSPYSNRWYQNASPFWKPYVPDFENLRFYLSYMAERVEVEDSLEGINYWGWHLHQPRYTTSLKPVLQMDQRNNRLFPTAGYLLEFRSEFANAYLGSGLLDKLESQSTSNNFLRLGTTTRFYYNFDQWFFLKNWVLKLNVDFGFLNTFGVQIVSENFRLGGVQLGAATGLRGYYFQSIGPVLNVSQQYSTQPIQQINVGGNKQFLSNLELEFPIAKTLNLSAVFFFDLGNVYSPFENLFYIGHKNLKNTHPQYWDPLGLFYGMGLYSAAGFGLRWLSPFGALRFEWGFPLVRRPHGTPGIPAGDSPVQFLFTIGQSF
ncbi:MAG: outer membrane protein assembly factor BamA [Myxococcaceae bacterium]|nr:outer membrane protein assembly factor BamA [Myxococcaceae bacterium]